MTTNNLVTTNNGKIFTTSLIVAEGVGNEHRAVIRLVRRYQADFEEFGKLSFENSVRSSTGKGEKTEYALLTEDQATYLMTLFRNTPIVRRFKVDLVKAFRRALNTINELRSKGQETRPKSALELLQASVLMLHTETNARLEALEADNRVKSKAIKALVKANNELADDLEGLTISFKDLKAHVEVTSTSYYTVAGYASLRGYHITASMASKLGKKASKASRDKDIPIGQVHSEVFGVVNVYHKDVLKKVMTPRAMAMLAETSRN